MLHWLADFMGLTHESRNACVATWRRLTRWRPKWYRHATACGLNTSPRDVKITVSLTSYPGRIKEVYATIDTLLTQTMKPDRLVLWLGEDKFPRRELQLPKRLLKLREFGLTIGWCRDLRSFTKLLPALESYPDDIVITADDDILYSPDVVETLYNSYLSDTKCVHTISAMKIEKDVNGKLTSYNDWWYCKGAKDKSYTNILMGVNGVLYPPHIMPKVVFDERIFRSIAPTVDDLWFWAMAVLGEHKICSISYDGWMKNCANFCASNAAALWNQNESTDSGNDKQLRDILKQFPEVAKRIGGY